MKFGMILLAAVELCVSASAQELHYKATNAWKAYIGWGSQGSPALGHDGTIYFATWAGYIVAFDPGGSERWRVKTGVEFASSPAVGADDTVYAGCRNRNLYAVDKDGRQKWVFKTGGWVDAS